MNIRKYTSYFHDGSVLDIRTINNDIELWLESAELLPEWNEDDIPLSKDATIKGKLHLKNVKSILVREQPVKQLKMIFDDGEISHLSIKGDTAILSVLWTNFPPKEDRDFTTTIITAEEIIWENDPELFYPVKANLYKKYLDCNGNHVRRGSLASYLYPPEEVHWDFKD